MATVIDGGYEWDSEKAETNLRKHGVSFEEAATVFADPNVAFDPDGSGTDCVKATGFSLRARILVAVHVERENRDRIISARPATAEETTLYSEGH